MIGFCLLMLSLSLALLPHNAYADDYSIDAPDSIINLDNRRRKTVLTAKKGKGTDADDPNLFVYRNDSLLLVLNEVWVDSTYQVNQINHQFQLFKK